MEQNTIQCNEELILLKNTRVKKPYAALAMPQQAYIKSFGELLNRYSWDWAVTLTFESPRSTQSMMKKFKRWKSRLCKEERIQVGYGLVLCSNPHSHIHGLLLGANRYGFTLAEVDKKKWVESWIENDEGRPLSLAANRIENVTSTFHYGAYMAINAARNEYEIEFSEPRFLKKFERTSESQFDRVCPTAFSFQY